MGKGYLKISLFVGDSVLPVKAMNVLVKDSRGNVLYEMLSDENGLVKEIGLEAPSKENSMYPNSGKPYFSIYDVEIPSHKGYKKYLVHGVQIFDGQTAILPVQLHPAIQGGTEQENTDEIYIPLEHGVDELRERKPQSETNERFLQERMMANEVQIPEYITVHLGSPNAAARNVRVPFADYIKNVASSEIFPTWEESALYANIYAQISFALNRTYTYIHR